MKNIYLSVFVLVLVVIAGIFLLKKPATVSNEVTYQLESEGLVFTYKDGPMGYVLEEHDIVELNNPQLMRVISLTPTNDYEDQKNRVGGEASPAWQLAVYNNHLKQSPSVWVDANPSASNINLVLGETQEAVVGGANAVAYAIDGLYKTDMVVIAHGGLMFVVSSSYLDENSPTNRDFSAWLQSFTFVPTPSQLQQGKIDVSVVCRNALAYTTFMNSDDAEKFVTECIDGKHPDVIERYIQDTGLDGAAL